MPIPVNVDADVKIVSPFDDEGELGDEREEVVSASPSRPLTEESQRQQYEQHHHQIRRPLTADNSITFEGKFNSSVSSPEQQLSSLLSGTTGLKPLQLQHNPMVPVNRPHTSSMTNYHNKTKQRGTGNINEGSVPGTGNSRGKTVLSTSLPNPSYMYEGSALENSIHDTLAAGGGTPHMTGSQSLANIKSNKSSLVLPTKRSGSAEVLILPDIHQPSAGGNPQHSTYEERPSSPTVLEHNDRGMLLTIPAGPSAGKKGKAPLGNPTKDPLIVISQMKIASHPRSNTMN
jgi:hypothetical protein